MSFVDEAKMRNHHMMEKYKSCLREQYSGKPQYNEATLSMLRRLEENLSVARIREKNVSILSSTSPSLPLSGWEGRKEGVEDEGGEGGRVR